MNDESADQRKLYEILDTTEYLNDYKDHIIEKYQKNISHHPENSQTLAKAINDLIHDRFDPYTLLGFLLAVNKNPACGNQYLVLIDLKRYGFDEYTIQGLITSVFQESLDIDFAIKKMLEFKQKNYSQSCIQVILGAILQHSQYAEDIFEVVTHLTEDKSDENIIIGYMSCLSFEPSDYVPDLLEVMTSAEYANFQKIVKQNPCHARIVLSGYAKLMKSNLLNHFTYEAILKNIQYADKLAKVFIYLKENGDVLNEISMSVVCQDPNNAESIAEAYVYLSQYFVLSDRKIEDIFRCKNLVEAFAILHQRNMRVSHEEFSFLCQNPDKAYDIVSLLVFIQYENLLNAEIQNAVCKNGCFAEEINTLIGAMDPLLNQEMLKAILNNTQYIKNISIALRQLKKINMFTSENILAICQHGEYAIEILNMLVGLENARPQSLLNSANRAIICKFGLYAKSITSACCALSAGNNLTQETLTLICHDPKRAIAIAYENGGKPEKTCVGLEDYAQIRYASQMIRQMRDSMGFLSDELCVRMASFAGKGVLEPKTVEETAINSLSVPKL